MTKQEIYEQVVRLTAELTAINLAQRIFEAAKTGDAKQVETVFESFKNENSELNQSAVEFGEKFNKLIEESKTGLDAEIFGDEENKEEGIFVLNADIINPLNLYALTLVSNIDDAYLMHVPSKSFDNFKEAFKEAGYEELEEFVACESWTDCIGEDEECEYPTLYDLLVTIFAGELKE